MSIYIKLDHKKFKLPDSLIIGRGCPFLSKDYSFSRSHIRIILKKNRWHIKDLGSKDGTTINGEKIRPGKFFAVLPGDVIYLGNIELSVHDFFPDEECEIVTKDITKDLLRFALKYSSLELIAIFAFLYFSDSLNNLTETMLALQVALIFAAMQLIAFYSTKRFIVSENRIMEVTLASEGMSLQLNGGTYSYLFKDITECEISGDYVHITSVFAKKTFITSKPEIKEILQEKCPTKIKKNNYNLTDFILITPGLVFYAIFSYVSANSYTEMAVYLAFCIIGASISLAMLLNEKMRNFLTMSETSKRSHQTATICILLATSLYGIPKIYQHMIMSKTALGMIPKCALKQEQVCEELKFNFVTKDSYKALTYHEKKFIRKSCHKGNSSACALYTPKRSIASQKK